MLVKDSKEIMQTVKGILEEEFTVLDSPVAVLHVSRYVKRLPEGADIEVSRFAPADTDKGEPGDDDRRLRIEKPLSRRELAQAIKEILGWN